jgi:hypothetical protein
MGPSPPYNQGPEPCEVCPISLFPVRACSRRAHPIQRISGFAPMANTRTDQSEPTEGVGGASVLRPPSARCRLRLAAEWSGRLMLEV